jgi:PIN domain nuclease of toxin-antitoxin system
VRYLFDTHAWLWLLLAPKRVGKKTKALVLDGRHEFHLSIASAWEIAVKHAAGRLALPEDPLEYVQSRTRDDGVKLLPIRLEHVCGAAVLPRHHADPFDRLLVSQARAEDLAIISHDENVALYDVRVIDPAR